MTKYLTIGALVAALLAVVFGAWQAARVSSYKSRAEKAEAAVSVLRATADADRKASTSKAVATDKRTKEKARAVQEDKAATEANRGWADEPLPDDIVARLLK